MTQLATTENPPLAISEEQEQAIQAGQSRLHEAALALVVDSVEAEEKAWVIVNGIGDLEKAIKRDFKASKESAHAAHRAVCDQEKGHLAGLKEPDRIVRRKLSEWAAEKERVRLVEEQRLRDEAKEKADEERRAEQERLQKEAEERQLEAAVEAEESGEHAHAAMILEEPVVVEAAPPTAPAFVPKVVAPKAEGAGAMVEVWKFEVVNPEAVPREYLMIETSAIRRVVQSQKGTASIPGVRIWSEKVPRRAGGR